MASGIYYIKHKVSEKERKELIQKALSHFAENLCKIPIDQELVNNAKLVVDQNGRPYFDNLDIMISISHSGSYFTLLFSEYPCGIDIQEKREVKCISISEKFYAPKETDLVRECGEDAFFRVWTTREAFGKMTGIGFHCNPPSFVDDDYSYMERVEYRGRYYNLISIDLDPEYYMAICTVEDEYKIYNLEELLKEKGFRKSAREAAYYKLGRGDVSEFMLRKHLKDKGYEREEIEEALEEIKSLGYIDDAKYGALYIRYGLNKGWAMGRIKRELAKRGVSSEDMARAYEEFRDREPDLHESSEDETERALEIARRIANPGDIEKGRLTDKIKGRIGRRLQSYGYVPSTVYKVINILEKELNEETEEGY